ncbi:MAG: hypothetical protein ACTSQJ_13485 [Promethearchaeota archaeon]
MIITRKIKINLLSILFLIVIFTGMSTTFVLAETNYNSALTKGTELYKVNVYDKKAWDEVIGKEKSPEDFFGDGANNIGAESKITIKSIFNTEWTFFDALISGLIPEEIVLFILINYTENDLNKDYTDDYKITYAFMSKWDYTTEEFGEEPDKPYDKLSMFMDPKDILKFLDNYNTLAEEINSTILVPILKGNDILWQMIIGGFGIPSPFNTYLENLINELNCENVDVKDNTLSIERTGEDDYIVEISYNSQGIQKSIVVKDSDGEKIYEIISSNTRGFVYILLIFIIFGTVGIIVLYKIKNRKIH